MKFGELNAVLKTTALSPEELAPIFDVGSMTIRRWTKESAQKMVPKGHQWRIIETIYQLVLAGKLSTDDAAVQAILRSSTPRSFQAIIHGMGVSESILSAKDNQQDTMTVILSQIGVNEDHKSEVEKSSQKLSYFKKMGGEWKSRISTLVAVIQSKKLTALDKMVAYGALFYLVTPFDLIPDHIPVIGLIDDFGVLGFAVAYYLKRFPAISANLKAAVEPRTS
jgi:uncharacterized membrane protein YkvA (DUF1232 family)